VRRPRDVILRRRHEPYPTEPTGDAEFVEGSRPYVVYKILTDAARPITHRELRERFAQTELGRDMGPDDNWHMYSANRLATAVGAEGV
jgi:hypothetical protein